MPHLTEIADLAVTKYKLAALVEDSNIKVTNPELADACLRQIISIDRYIMTLNIAQRNSVHEDNYHKTGD